MPKHGLRDCILKSALVEFHRLGFNGCSVEDITSRAGAPKGSFYNHFKSKEDIAVAVIQAHVEGKPQQILRDSTIAPLERLERYFGELLRPFIDGGFERGCLLANFASELADHSPAVRQKLEAAFADWTASLAEAIQEGQESGEISRAQSPEVWARFLVSCYEGALLRARTMRSAAPLQEFTQVALKLLSSK